MAKNSCADVLHWYDFLVRVICYHIEHVHKYIDLGYDLVDWLMEHVHGITDRKAARIYASKLLAAGHIKHVVNKLTFTEKCYYIFEGDVSFFFKKKIFLLLL